MKLSRICEAVAMVSLAIAIWSPIPAVAAESPADLLTAGSRMIAMNKAYQRHCASCHGSGGEGGRADIDFTSPEAVADLTREKMISAIETRHDAPTRAQWQDVLTSAAKGELVDFIRENFMLPAPFADASTGRRIYARRCSVCHGDRGDGASWAKNALSPPPADFTSDKFRKLTRRQMINSVTYGRPNTAMMPFATRYSRDEIGAVVDYIRRNFMQLSAVSATQQAASPPASAAPHGHDAGHARPPAHAPGQAPQQTARAHGHAGHDDGDGPTDMNAPFPRNLAGDFARGKRFYESNCIECHGPDGKGDGRRAYFMVFKPANFTTEKARAELNRPHLFNSISMGVKGTGMAAWSKVLEDQQIADVAEYVFRTFIRPTAAAGPTGRSKTPAPSWQVPQEKKK